MEPRFLVDLSTQPVRSRTTSTPGPLGVRPNSGRKRTTSPDFVHLVGSFSFVHFVGTFGGWFRYSSFRVAPVFRFFTLPFQLRWSIRILFVRLSISRSTSCGAAFGSLCTAPR